MSTFKNLQICWRFLIRQVINFVYSLEDWGLPLDSDLFKGQWAWFWLLTPSLITFLYYFVTYFTFTVNIPIFCDIPYFVVRHISSPWHFVCFPYHDYHFFTNEPVIFLLYIFIGRATRMQARHYKRFEITYLPNFIVVKLFIIYKNETKCNDIKNREDRAFKRLLGNRHACFHQDSWRAMK